MKKVLIICGTGVATSTLVASKVRDFLSDEGIDASVAQGKVMDLVGGDVSADLIVATTQIPGDVTIPVVGAVPLLTGFGEENVFAEIRNHLV